MSNYNSTLQSNNTDLQAILNQINELPEAGEQATPVISVNSNGLITATAGTKSTTKQLAFQSAKTITPTATSQIAVSSGYYTGGNVMVAGDSNLVAENIVSGKSIFGVVGNYKENSSGNTDAEDKIIQRTITSYTNDRVKTVGSYAFACCSNLTFVDFPICTFISDYAFIYCTNLTAINFPACTSIGYSAFSPCISLTTVSFSTCTFISGYAFAKCINLTTVNFPNCTSISERAFSQCTNLTTINFPKCLVIGSGAFSQCTNLNSVNFPICTFISDYAFASCCNLSIINFPKCITIKTGAFSKCTSLTAVSFPACTSIGYSAFINCTALSRIYLTASSICSLAMSNAFSGTSIWSNKGSIFVPSSLVASYKKATNWAYFSNRIYSA